MREYIKSEGVNNQSNSIDYRSILITLLRNWYWFVISITICIAAGWYYIQSQSPIYSVMSSIIINDEGSNSSALGENLETMGVISSTSNFDNELAILKSSSLIHKTILDLELYIIYSHAGRFRDEEIYNMTPIKVWISPEEAANIYTPIDLSIVKLPNSSVNVEVTIDDQIVSRTVDKFPAIITTPMGALGLTLPDSVKFARWSSELPLLVNISSPRSKINEYKRGLSVYRLMQSTTIAHPTLLTSNGQRGIDFLDKLIDTYNFEANDAKNEAANKTADFINERLLIISRELNDTELELESYKRNAGIINIVSDAQMTLGESAEYKLRVEENSAKIQSVKSLNDLLRSEDTINDPLPITIEDTQLSELIANYNEMLLERRRMLIISSEDNPAVININRSIASTRNILLEAINSRYQVLMAQQAELNKASESTKGRIANIPTRERELISLERQQEIKADLFLTLLQKREENAMLLASTANNARVFDETSIEGPISPNMQMIYIIATILGLLIPSITLLIIDLFKFKINGRRDVEKITKISIVGEIPLSKRQNAKGSIVVFENKNDIMAETFRNLRTNIFFMLSGREKVILITSTSSGEGKSFIAANLAISFALMGKKVVIVGLDIRKPGLNKAFCATTRRSGLSNFLVDPTMDIGTLIERSEVSSNLDILYGGAIPPNPTELLSRDSLQQAIALLKERYDYVILDTAPIGMVTDTQIIARVADISLYVCRSNYTHKSDFELINEIAADNKLPKLTTVINGTDPDKSSGVYGRRYGYGYGYGYGQDQSTKR